MSPEAQLIAIAEHFRWSRKIYPDSGYSWINPAGESWVVDADGNGAYPWPPCYLTDLNAMYEAEKTLKAWDLVEFRRILAQRFFSKDEFNETLSWECMFARAIHATAAQRAEAFLRTIGKWEQ